MGVEGLDGGLGARGIFLAGWRTGAGERGGSAVWF